jgi:hypothetical protein
MDDITGLLGVLNVFSNIRPLARCLVASEGFLPKVGLHPRCPSPVCTDLLGTMQQTVHMRPTAMILMMTGAG